jgi:hypothetical protein
LKRETPESRENRKFSASFFPKNESYKKFDLTLEDGSVFSGYSFGFESLNSKAKLVLSCNIEDGIGNLWL